MVVLFFSFFLPPLAAVRLYVTSTLLLGNKIISEELNHSFVLSQRALRGLVLCIGIVS